MRPVPRLKLLLDFERENLGRQVVMVITASWVEGGQMTVRGELVAVASPRLGTASDLVVLRRAGQPCAEAWSASRVVSIEAA